MSNTAIQTIITIGFVGLGGFIAVFYQIKSNKRQELENQQLAKDLNWNFHHGCPSTKGRQLFLNGDVEQYAWNYFDGVYQNFPFTLFSFFVPKGKYGQVNYLVTEMDTKSNKNYDFIVFGKEDNSVLNKLEDVLAPSLKEYKNVKLESDEFNQNFLVYTKQSDEAFYDLPPDKMSKLIEIKRNSVLAKIYLEVKPGAILIYSEYAPFDDWVGGKNKITKKEILSGFMDIAVAFTNVLIS